jgi:tRNA dimethylallyltransferase
VGYSEAVAVIRGRMTVKQAIENTQQRTRNYAKRQMTWFRKEKDVRWLDGFGDDAKVQEKALAMLG